MALMPMTKRSHDRKGTKVIWIGFHTAESPDRPNVKDAVSLRDAAWWEGSSHAICDNEGLLDEHSGCVDPGRAAWTLRDGNSRSVNIEQIGYAGRSREEWLDKYMQTIRYAAQWAARMSKMFDIPLSYIGTQGVREGRSGVIQHNDYTQGTGDGSHWDCGPGYPMDVAIDLAREYANPTAPTPAPAPKRRSSEMFLFRSSAGSGTRLFTGAAKSMTYDFSDANAAEISKALNGEYIAKVGPQAFDELIKALGK